MTSLIQPIGPIMPITPDRLSEFDAGVILTTMLRLACLFLFYWLVYKITKVIVSKTPGFQKENKKIPIYHCINIFFIMHSPFYVKISIPSILNANLGNVVSSYSINRPLSIYSIPP